MQTLEANPHVDFTADISRFDGPIEGAVAYFRSGLLTDPTVERHILHLAELRDAVPWGIPWPTMAGCEYVSAVESSRLRQWFAYSEVDHLATIIRQRRELGVWRYLYIVNPARSSYGRSAKRVRKEPLTLDRLEFGIADGVRQIDSSASCHTLEAEHQTTIRVYRKRLRELLHR